MVMTEGGIVRVSFVKEGLLLRALKSAFYLSNIVNGGYVCKYWEGYVRCYSEGFGDSEGSVG